MSFSVCIPRIFNNIPTSKIVNTFEVLDIGKVDKVDIIMKIGKYGEPIKMAFVHFSEWYNNSTAFNLRNKIENPYEDAKLVYDDPWYWIILPNLSNTNTNMNTNMNQNMKVISNNTINAMNDMNAMNNNTINAMNDRNIMNNNTINAMNDKLVELSNEIDCIYEEIYQKEYISNSNTNHTPDLWNTYWDINTDTDTNRNLNTDMDMETNSMESHDTPLHCSPTRHRHTLIYPEQELYDVELELNSDSESDTTELESYSQLSMNIKDSSSLKRKLWMTQNICGN